MKTAGDKLAIGTLVLGLALGGLAGWFLARPSSNPSANPTPASTLPAGFQAVTLADIGLKFAIRQSDQMARLKNDDKIIGYKIIDPYAQTTGAQIDVVTVRVEEFFDLPHATKLEEYNQPMTGLTIQKSLNVNLNGFTGLKQLYTASLPQKRGDGAIIKKPISNLMRYVILTPDSRIILFKTSATFQKYLDEFVAHLQLVPISQATEGQTGINLGTDSDIKIAPDATDKELINPAASSQNLNVQ